MPGLLELIGEGNSIRPTSSLALPLSEAAKGYEIFDKKEALSQGCFDSGLSTWLPQTTTVIAVASLHTAR